MTLETLLTFSGSSLLLILSPGPDNQAVLAYGLSHGKRVAIAFGIGCGLGCLFHTTLASLGVSALLAANEQALQLIQTVGGLYLIYLGMQIGIAQIRPTPAISKPASQRETPSAESRLSVVTYFRQGLLANVLNPKVSLFFLSYLPGFVEHKQQAAVELLLLGSLFTLLACMCFGMLGLFAGQLGEQFAQSTRFQQLMQWVTACVLAGLGLLLLLH